MTAFFNRHLALGLAAATLLLAGCQNLSSPVIRFDRQVNYGDAKGVELVTNEFGSSDLQRHHWARGCRGAGGRVPGRTYRQRRWRLRRP